MPEVVKRYYSKTIEAKTATSVLAKQVYQQLLPDFPATAIQWVLRNPWFGPVKIDLDQIDFDNRANWTASHEPKKVALHQQLIQEGKSKPVILAQLPGHDKFVCLDAHHRLLAYEALGQEPECYVVSVRPADTEAAIQMHSSQYSGGSKLSTLDGT